MVLGGYRPGAGHGNASQENSSSWFAIVRPESNRRRSLESNSNARRRSPTVRTANLQPHQFRTRNDLTETQQTQSRADENGAKSTKLIDSLPLITVRLQVRILPGPPVNSTTCLRRRYTAVFHRLHDDKRRRIRHMRKARNLFSQHLPILFYISGSNLQQVVK
jgi:hypothetical protein